MIANARRMKTAVGPGRAIVIMAVCALSAGAPAKGMKFGIAGKRADDANFIAVWEGCAKAARQYGDECINIGSPGPANVRKQDDAIVEAVAKGIDGLAVSVTNSERLARSALSKALHKKIPVLTFDSDLDKGRAHLRKGYVGPDNLKIGSDLASLAMRFRPPGGTVCLMSGDPYNPNLNERMAGVRRMLSGQAAFPADRKLQGEGGWREVSRCPFFNFDQPGMAVEQMKTAFASEKADVLVSVGHWPVLDLARYRQSLTELKKTDRDFDKRLIIIGIGKLMPAQQELLQERLVHGYVSIDFEEMGRIAYFHLKRLAQGKAIPLLTHSRHSIYVRTDQ